MICKKLEDLKQYHEQILNLVGSFRSRKVDIVEFSKEVPTDAIYCLLIKKNTLVGMYRYYRVSSSFLKEYKLPTKYSKYYQIATVIVDPTQRGKGYGKAMMRHASKIGNMILDTYLSWMPAIKTYLSAGYRIIATKKTKRDKKEDYLVVFTN